MTPSPQPTGLKRTPMARKLRERKCKCGCGVKYRPWSSMQKAATPDCAIRLVAADNAKKQKEAEIRQKKQTTKERREHKQKVDANRSLAWHIDRTRTACHAYIKARDFGLPCICCGEPLDWFGDPQQVQAGHWRTQAAAGHLRFNPDNIHAQRAYCNGNQAGNQSKMEQGMIARIGLERVEALRNNNEIKNWTREELTELWIYFKAETKRLKKERAI